ncbi:MAG: nucleoside hydrolase [Bacteroidales bacterium]
MKSGSLFILLSILTFILTGCQGSTVKEKNQVKIIFDTDLGPDYDDVGALAFLHCMADSGKAELLATIASNKHELVAPCIEIINTYFGRPDIPIGAPAGRGVSLTASQHWPDSLVKKYPHRLSSTSMTEDAVKVYRRILSSQPDSSVTIVTVGFLTNLADLLKSPPDSYSELSGNELVGRKVKSLVAMAGWFPEGKEFNVMMDSTSSEYVFNEWPGKIIFTGFEIGSKIFTGLNLIKSEAVDSPVKDVFAISIPFSAEDANGRMSWDETAVLIAVYGTSEFFESKKGNILVSSDGNNGWQDDPEGKHSYVTMKMDASDIARFIEKRMMHIPIKTKK